MFHSFDFSVSNRGIVLYFKIVLNVVEEPALQKKYLLGINVGNDEELIFLSLLICANCTNFTE